MECNKYVGMNMTDLKVVLYVFIKVTLTCTILGKIIYFPRSVTFKESALNTQSKHIYGQLEDSGETLL
jgi:hypothetical protein